MIETFALAIEGIGHVLRTEMRRVVEEAADLVARLPGRKPDKFLHIRSIHRKQKIEARKIAAGDLSRALRRDVNAAPSRGRLRAGVRRLAGVPIAKPGGIDIEEMQHAFFRGDTAERAFGHRRTADIAEADEKETVFDHAGEMASLPVARKWFAPSLQVRCGYHTFRCGPGLPCEETTMVAWNEAGELRNAALGRGLVPAALAERERKVRREFWAKIKRVLARVPFAEDLVAAYYCALDPETPLRVRGMLLAAIAYFILPGDFIPDIIAGLGFADDMALVTAVIGMVASHITPVHRAAAARALGKGGPAAASAAD